MQGISLEVIIAAVFGVTDPDRVERLRAATLALMREGNSRRFFLQMMVVIARGGGWDGRFPRIRRAMAAVDAIVLEEVAQRRRAAVPEQEDVSGCSCAHATRTALRCPIAKSATRCARCCWADTRPPPPRSHGYSSASAATLTCSHAWRRPRSTEMTTTSTRSSRRRCACARSSRITARLATEPFELPGLTIPAGTLVVPYITLVHRRPDLYPDPLAFRPERFLDTRAGTYTWIPFGGGPRRCIGAAFSLMETRIVLRTMLRHARLMPSFKRAERVARHTVTIVPARGGTITLTRRRLTPRSAHRPAADSMPVA